jgi:hypothetical protein
LATSVLIAKEALFLDGVIDRQRLKPNDADQPLGLLWIAVNRIHLRRTNWQGVERDLLSPAVIDHEIVHDYHGFGDNAYADITG